MKVKDVMTKNVITIDNNATVLEAANLMEKYDIGFLPVLKKSKLIGVLTDRDIVLRGILKNNMDKTIDDIMTHTYVSCKESDDISIAISTMSDYQLHRLVVINNSEELTGVLSIANIANNNQINKYLCVMLSEICTPNPQKEKPLKYLKVDDFPL